MDSTQELAYWQERLAQARTALLKRGKNAHIDNYQQNGVTVDYSDMEQLRIDVSKCEREVNRCQKLINGQATSIFGKRVSIR